MKTKERINKWARKQIEKDYDVIPVFILACIIGLTAKEKGAVA